MANISKIRYNGTDYDIVGLDKNMSTDEQVIGTWIDGKPLYRKVLQTSTTSSSSMATISKSLISSDLDKIVRWSGYSVQVTNNMTPIPYYISSTDFCQLYFTVNTYSLVVKTGTEHGFGTHYVILEYTKTTDTANS